MLDPNMMVNDDDDDVDNDVDDEIMPRVPEFGYAFRSSFVIFNDWALSHRRMPEGSELEVEQTFSSKNELVNEVK